MISHVLLLFSVTAFLGGGSIHGVVVDKTFKPLPLSHSLGVPGIYRLDLRDKDKTIRHQMVSQEIFAAYEVGDEFDDRLSVAEVRQRRAERAAKEAERAAAEQIAAEEDRKENSGQHEVAQLLLRQDMLPETEGF